MSHRVVINLLRALLSAAAAVILLLQVLFLPWLSGEVARDLPAEA